MLVSLRISDRRMLHLIKMWLHAPVEEIDRRGRHRRTTRARDTGRGCPQGAPISPLLSNLYMRRVVLGWKVLGYERRFGAEIVNYVVMRSVAPSVPDTAPTWKALAAT